MTPTNKALRADARLELTEANERCATLRTEIAGYDRKIRRKAEKDAPCSVAQDAATALLP